ncbi:ComEC family competence protein [Candidatus Tokpelaia sp.]|nr:ComEC family competence protein [Candidatus Tokpelaia sp.]
MKKQGGAVKSRGEKKQKSGFGQFAVPYFTLPRRAGFLQQFCRPMLLRLRFRLSEEEAFGTRFLFLPFFLGAGIIAYFTLSFEPDWSELGAFCCCAAGLACLLRRHRFWHLVFSFILVAGLGALCAKGETARYATIMLRNGGFTHIVARITAIERQEKGDYRLIVTVLSTRDPVLQPAPQRLRLLVRHLPIGAKSGSGLEGLVFLRSFSGPAHPGGYDFAFQNYFRGISGQGNFAGQPKIVSLPPPGAAEQAGLQLAALRQSISKRIIAAIGGETGAVAAALITGERAGITPATNQALRLSGLAHILSISGLHMALVAGMVLLLCRWILGLFPVFSSRHAAGKIAAFAAMLVAGAYLAISGADVAAERSFVMVAVMLGAVICDRAAISLRNLAVSACLILLWQPHEIMGPSFQMSFAATAALISAFAGWSRYRHDKNEQAELAALARGLPKAPYTPLPKIQLYMRNRLFAPLVSTCISSLVAGAAGGLYSAYHFNNTAPYGVLSNALALPMISFLVMPFALLGTVLMPLHLEAWPLHIMAVGLVGVEKVAYWVAGFSPNGNPGFISPLCLIFLTAGMVLLVFLQTGLRWLALVFIAIGCSLYAAMPLPLALIAENGRLTAIFNADKSLGLSSNRPSAFLLQDWQRAFAASAALPPGREESATLPPAEEGGQSGNRERENREQQRFFCHKAFCRARLRNGKVLTIAEAIEARQQAWREGDIIVLNFIADRRQEEIWHKTAADSGKILITMRDLALFGAAEIRLPLWRRVRLAEILWAAGAPLRPWNAYRRFSRRAQGMPS